MSSDTSETCLTSVLSLSLAKQNLEKCPFLLQILQLTLSAGHLGLFATCCELPQRKHFLLSFFLEELELLYLDLTKLEFLEVVRPISSLDSFSNWSHHVLPSRATLAISSALFKVRSFSKRSFSLSLTGAFKII